MGEEVPQGMVLPTVGRDLPLVEFCLKLQGLAKGEAASPAPLSRK